MGYWSSPVSSAASSAPLTLDRIKEGMARMDARASVRCGSAERPHTLSPGGRVCFDCGWLSAAPVESFVELSRRLAT